MTTKIKDNWNDKKITKALKQLSNIFDSSDNRLILMTIKEIILMKRINRICNQKET